MLRESEVVNVCILGPESVGKTSLLFGSDGKGYISRWSTRGSALHFMNMDVAERSLHFCMMDTPGKENYRSQLNPMLLGFDHQKPPQIYVWMVDLTNSSSVADIRKIHSEVMKKSKTNTAIHVLVANKTDRAADSQVFDSDLGQLKTDLGCETVYKMSASTGTGVIDFFQSLGEMYVQRFSAPLPIQQAVQSAALLPVTVTVDNLSLYRQLLTQFRDTQLKREVIRSSGAKSQAFSQIDIAANSESKDVDAKLIAMVNAASIHRDNTGIKGFFNQFRKPSSYHVLKRELQKNGLQMPTKPTKQWCRKK